MAAPSFPSTPLQTVASHTGPINALTFSASGGTYILTGSSDRQIHLSRSIPPTSSSSSSSSTTPKEPPVSTTPIQRYTSHGYSILSVCVSLSNAHFASSDSSPHGGGLFLWDVERPTTTLRRFAGHDRPVLSTTFAGAEDSLLVSGSQDATVRIWDLKSGSATKPVQVLGDAKDGVSSVWVESEGGVEIVTGSVDARVRRYDLRMGRVLIDVLPAAVTSVQGTADGNAMLVRTLDSTVRLLDCRDGRLLQTFRAEGFVNRELRLKSALGCGDAVVVAGSEDGGLFGWDVLSGEVNWKSGKGVHGGKVVSAVAWADNGGVGKKSGNTWASGGADGKVIVWGSA